VTAIRTQPGSGDTFTLTCPDCLRTFTAICLPEDKTVEQIAACPHCEAQVPFQLETATSP
jgi:hypothetical protein